MDFSVIGPASLKSMGGKTKRAGDTFIAQSGRSRKNWGCSVRTAGKLITELQEKGFLEKERQGQGKPKRDNLADTTDPQASLLPT